MGKTPLPETAYDLIRLRDQIIKDMRVEIIDCHLALDKVIIQRDEWKTLAINENRNTLVLKEEWQAAMKERDEARWWAGWMKRERDAAIADRDSWEDTCLTTASEVHGGDVTEIELRDELAAAIARAEKAEKKLDIAIAAMNDIRHGPIGEINGWKAYGVLEGIAIAAMQKIDACDKDGV